jgi:hypothetical protein
MLRPKILITLILFLIVLLALGFLFIHECFSGGGMDAAYQSCDCAGIEWVQYDRTAADGQRRTLCIGSVQARECYQYPGGPAYVCDSDDQVALRTDKQVYEAGGKIIVIIENKTASPIRYYGFCSLNLCQFHEGEWFCEMKDCYGEMVVIEAGDSIEIETQAMEPVGTRLRYRLEYQTIAEEVLYTVESNEFEVR